MKKSVKKYLFLLPVICGLCSCTQQKEAAPVRSIELGDMYHTDWASRIHIDSIVPLEMNDTALLSIAQKCLVSEDRIFFSDYKAKRVFAYDRQGRFLFTVGNRGGAGNEYLELRDVILSKDNSLVEILDPTGILVYSADDGHFIEKKKIEGVDLNFCYRFVHCPDDSYLLFSVGNDFSIYRYGKEGVEGLRKRSGEQLITDRFYETGKECLVIPDYGKFVIDSYQEGKLSPKYKINLNGQELPEELLPQDFDQFNQVDNMETYFKSVTELIENDSLLFVRLVGPSRKYYDVYWDKKSGKIVSGKADMSMGLVFETAVGNSIYALAYPDYMSKESVLYPLFEKYLADDMNPIFVKLRLNER